MDSHQEKQTVQIPRPATAKTVPHGIQTVLPARPQHDGAEASPTVEAAARIHQLPIDAGPIDGNDTVPGSNHSVISIGASESKASLASGGAPPSWPSLGVFSTEAPPLRDTVAFVTKKTGRPRKPKETTRLISGQVPESQADAFMETCDALGTTQSEAVRTFVRSFIAEHAQARTDYRTRQQEEQLPDVG